MSEAIRLVITKIRNHRAISVDGVPPGGVGKGNNFSRKEEKKITVLLSVQ